MLEQQISARAGDDAALSISLGIGGYKRLRELTASRLNDFHDIRNVPQYSPYVSAFHIESFRSLMSKENDGSIAPPLEVPVVEVPVVEVPVVEVPVVEVPVVEVPVVEFDLKTSENEDDSKLDKVKKYFEEKLGNKNG
jgi:hypothetical protein